jgi:hypothetical protein
MQGAGRGIYEITFIDPEVFEAVKNNPKSFEKIVTNNMQSTNDDRVLMAEAQRLQRRGLMVYVRGPGLAHQGWLD